jgi:fatty acid desaturase
MKTNCYAEHTRGLKEDLATSVDREILRRLHERRPARHFRVAARQVLVLGIAVAGVLRAGQGWGWLPFAMLAGWTVFNFTVLLHEVVHGLVFSRARPLLSRALALAYAIPSGISASQFTRWHLDHHAELGCAEGDPKRHHLSPKRNRRWLKALYFTPALFPIYFRAAAREAASYPAELQARIARERRITIGAQLALAAGIGLWGGPSLLFRLYVVPVFLVFPIAFALNRLGQHYDIQPAEPAAWSTLMKPSRFWDFAYLWSNYHLEHHYYPGVPFYNLPRLRAALEPFLRARGLRPRGYVQLLYGYLVLNRRPHTDWAAAGREGGAEAGA